MTSHVTFYHHAMENPRSCLPNCKCHQTYLDLVTTDLSTAAAGSALPQIQALSQLSFTSIFSFFYTGLSDATSLSDSVANIPFDFQAFGANTAGTAACSCCYDSSLADHTTNCVPAIGVQVGGHQVISYSHLQKARAKSMYLSVFNACLHTIHFFLHLLIVNTFFSLLIEMVPADRILTECIVK